jgi:hypothetical protein
VRRSPRKLRAALALALATTAAQADTAELDGLLPRGDVIGFKLPMFTPEGWREWVLAGERGRFVNEDRIEVEAMDLRQYSANEKNVLLLTILSEKAVFAPRSGSAYGESPITLVGRDYRASGHGWTWEAETGSVRVRSNVEVVFAQPMMDILR